MKYSFVLSLQHIAACKIVTALWNKADIKALIVKFDCSKIKFGSTERYLPVDLRWKEIEDKVIKKVSLLPDLGIYKEKILEYVKPLGDQILRWKAYTETFCEFQFCLGNFPKDFCWTSQGILDEKKMADVLVKDLTIRESERLRLASLYCIETQWDKLHTYTRKGPLVEEESLERNMGVDAFIAFWTYNITGDMSVLVDIMRNTQNTPYQCAFEWAVYYMNSVAAEYYYYKLAPEEREESLFKVRLKNARIRSNFDVFRFLLLQMNEQQQLKLLEEFPLKVLISLLRWPWQGFFMEMANRAWGFLDGFTYGYLLIEIVDKVIDGYKDYSYKKLFGKFWVQSPLDLKLHSIYCMRRKNFSCFKGVLWKLFQVSDTKNVMLFLKSLTSEKREITFSNEGIRVYESLNKSDEWGLLEFFISQFISFHETKIKFTDGCLKSCNILSQDIMMDFRDECADDCIEKKRIFLNQFFPFIDGLIKTCSNEESWCIEETN